MQSLRKSSKINLNPEKLRNLRLKNHLAVKNGVPNLSDLKQEVAAAMQAFPLMSTIFEEEKIGEAETRYEFVDSKWAKQARNRAIELAKTQDLATIYFGLQDYTESNITYTDLYVNNVAMMGDEPGERMTNMDLWVNAQGDVLIGGLGIGMVVCGLMAKPEVSSITVVEKSKNVIDLIIPNLVPYLTQFHKEFTIIQADVLTYKPNHFYDTIYMDIWPNMSTKNLPIYKNLKIKYRHFLKNSNAWLACWGEDYIKAKNGLAQNEY